MDSTTIELKNALRLDGETAERVVRALEALVKRKTAEETADRIEARVEKEMAREARLLATREDLNTLKEEMHAMGDRITAKMQAWFLWIIAILVAVMGSFVATLFSVLQMGLPK